MGIEDRKALQQFSRVRDVDVATYVHTNGYLGETWLSVESPILKDNDIIISEVIIDAKWQGL